MPLSPSRFIVLSGRPHHRLSAASSHLKLPRHCQQLHELRANQRLAPHRSFSSTTQNPDQQRGADLVRRRQLLNRVREYQLTRGKNTKTIDEMSINKPNVREVLKGKYPAKTHARKVKEWVIANGGDAEGVVYLEGQKTKMNEVRISSSDVSLSRFSAC